MTRMILTRPLMAFLAVAGLSVSSRSAESKEGVKITQLDDRLRIEINGQLFSEYHFKDVSRPFLYPVIGPDGLPMTRDWPMKEGENEEHDHKHHRSIWFAHEINGVDFWSEEPKAGKTVHEEFTEIKSGRDAGLIRSKNKYVGPDGKVVCTDDRTLRIYNRPNDERLFDFEITIHASNGQVLFGDTKEGTMALRLNETVRLTPNKFNQGKPTGHIVNSEGVRDGETWGKRADWCDYHGPVNGKIVGVAILDHPKNPRHPTWWHVRDYGLFAANPFGLHDFEKKPAGAGNFTVPADKNATFRYRFYFHRGDEKQAKVAEHYADYTKASFSRDHE